MGLWFRYKISSKFCVFWFLTSLVEKWLNLIGLFLRWRLDRVRETLEVYSALYQARNKRTRWPLVHPSSEPRCPFPSFNSFLQAFCHSKQNKTSNKQKTNKQTTWFWWLQHFFPQYLFTLPFVRVTHLTPILVSVTSVMFVSLFNQWWENSTILFFCPFPNTL